MLAAGPVSKMASQQEKAFRVLRFEVSRSVITVHCEFRARFSKDAPCRNDITKWYREFVETGCLCKGKIPGRPRVSDDNIERVLEVFLRSPRKSVARASRELDMPKMTVWKVLCKWLCFKLYKIRLVQALTPADKVKRHDFCEEMQLKMEKNDFVERLIFCDEATFHISDKVNVHNVRIWGTKQPHAQIEHQRDSKSQRFLCSVPRESAQPSFLHWSNCDWRLISRHVGKLDVTPTEHQLWRWHSTTGWYSSPFSQECMGASKSCSSAALDWTCCKRRQPPSPLATPFTGSNTMRFLSLGVR